MDFLKRGTSESGRRVRIYALTRAGRRQLDKEEAHWAAPGSPPAAQAAFRTTSAGPPSETWSAPELERVAMKLSRHKTRSVFDRYNVVSEGDLRTPRVGLGTLVGTLTRQ